MKHERKCWGCGNVAEHEDNIVPHVLCKSCGSQDTRPTKKIPAKVDHIPHERIKLAIIQSTCELLAQWDLDLLAGLESELVLTNGDKYVIEVRREGPSHRVPCNKSLRE